MTDSDCNKTLDSDCNLCPYILMTKKASSLTILYDTKSKLVLGNFYPITEWYQYMVWLFVLVDSIELSVLCCHETYDCRIMCRSFQCVHLNNTTQVSTRWVGIISGWMVFTMCRRTLVPDLISRRSQRRSNVMIPALFYLTHSVLLNIAVWPTLTYIFIT